MRNVGRRGCPNYAHTRPMWHERGGGSKACVWCMELRSRGGSREKGRGKEKVGEEEDEDASASAFKQETTSHKQSKNVPFHFSHPHVHYNLQDLFLCLCGGPPRKASALLPGSRTNIIPSPSSGHQAAGHHHTTTSTAQQCPPSSTPCVPRVPLRRRPTPRMPA